MIAMTFLVGGVFGLIGALATLGLTDAGWGVVVAVYFAVGYTPPLLALVINWLRGLLNALQGEGLSGESSGVGAIPSQLQ